MSVRRLIGVALLGCGVLGSAAGVWAWRRATAPVPPVLDLSHVETPVARAIDQARTEVLRRPRSADAWGHLGMTLLAHELFEEAGASFRQAEVLDPADVRWAYLQAVLPGNPDPQDQIPHLQRAVALPGADPVTRLKLGEVLLEADRSDEAEAEFRRVLQSDAGNARAHLGMARVLRSRGAFRESVPHLLASAAGAPRVRTTQAILAETYHRLGDADAADRHRRLAAAAPDAALWPDPYLEQVMHREVGSTALLLRAEGFLAYRRYDLALGVARRLVEVHPTRADGHFLLWRVLTALGQTAEADRALGEGVRLVPDTVQSLYYQGIDLVRQQRLTLAVGYFRDVTAREPAFAAAHCDLGETLARLDDRPAARRSLEECVRLRPNLARGHRALGELLASVGERDEAAAHLEQADALEPLSGQAKALLARLQAEQTTPRRGGVETPGS